MSKGYLAGAFDLLGVRDLEVINSTRQGCDHLTVGVHSDDLVVRTLGQAPIVPLEERAEVVSHIRGVDDVVIHHEIDPRFARLSARDVPGSRHGATPHGVTRPRVQHEQDDVDHELHHDHVAALRAGFRADGAAAGDGPSTSSGPSPSGSEADHAQPQKSVAGAVLGYVPGAWDMFHIGHLNILNRARQQCDLLVVGAVTDEELVRAKGRAPIVPLAERKELLAGLDLVDLVVTDYATDKLDVWSRVGFDVLFKGDDWKGTAKGDLLERRMRSAGVRVCYFPYTQHTSSTKLRQLLSDTCAIA